MRNRSALNFDKHIVEVTEQKGLFVHYIRVPGTVTNAIKFINTNGILAVTGDFGNWIFCRPFVPSIVTDFVSDGYWKEKLTIASTQSPDEYDPEKTKKELKYGIRTGLKEYGYTGYKLKAAKEYFKECLDYCELSEHEYTSFAYNHYPGFMDCEEVIFCKSTNPWLQCVFDAFDEICERYRSKPETIFIKEDQS